MSDARAIFPAGLDPHAEASFKSRTVHEYRSAGADFVIWARSQGVVPYFSYEWDDLLVEWKNSDKVSLGKFCNTIACLEAWHPRFKGQLKWARDVSKRWAKVGFTNHCTPSPKGLTALISTHLAAAGLPRQGFAPWFQSITGLRPSEMLRLTGASAMLPPQHGPGQRCIIFRLGVAVGGTKAKREQYCIIWESRDPETFRLAEKLVGSTGSSELLFPMSIDQYRRLIRKVLQFLGLDIALSPHSFRASFVVDGISAGRDRAAIREEGRWVTESAFKVYADIIGSLVVAAHASASQLLPAQRYALQHLEAYWPAFPPCPDVSSGQPLRGRGLLPSRRGGAAGPSTEKRAPHPGAGHVWRRYAAGFGPPRRQATVATGSACHRDSSESEGSDPDAA
jgi:hypothetical protein